MKNLLFIIVLLLSTTLFSQNLIHINGRDYIRENDQWFIKDLESDDKFLLNEISMTVKLKETAPRQALTALNNAHNITIVGENELGYIDLKMIPGSVFHQKLNAYLNSGLFESVEMNSYGYRAAIPNDPLFGNQYHWFNTVGWPHINAPAAWDIENGSTNPVTVAVIDWGVWQTHADLNLSPIQWDFWDDDPDPSPDPPSDDHGTGVAGVFGAKTNNGDVVSGLAGGWGGNLGSKIMAIRIGKEIYIRTDKVDDAIIFAVNNGAKIINMSFWVDETQAIKAAIDYAYNQKGCLMVAAAGNQINQTTISFPARHPKVHSVGGITKTWLYYNNRDIYYRLDVVAPNDNIISTSNGTYAWSQFSGTSFSSPMVAGVGALLFSKNPDLLHMDARKVINQTATYTQQMEYDPTKFGNGLLQAGSALWALNLGNCIIPDYPTELTVINNLPHSLRWRTVIMTNCEEGDGTSHYNVYRSTLPNRYNFTKIAEVQHNDANYYTSWTDGAYPSGGTYFYRITTVDMSGKESITSNEVSITNGGIEEKIGFDIQPEVVFDYELEQNHPNPFNPSTIIKYSIKEDGYVKLAVFNIIGQEIKTLVNEFKNAGIYSVQFDASELPSGVYVYQLLSGWYSNSKKMLITK